MAECPRSQPYMTVNNDNISQLKDGSSLSSRDRSRSPLSEVASSQRISDSHLKSKPKDSRESHRQFKTKSHDRPASYTSSQISVTEIVQASERSAIRTKDSYYNDRPLSRSEWDYSSSQWPQSSSLSRSRSKYPYDRHLNKSSLQHNETRRRDRSRSKSQVRHSDRSLSRESRRSWSFSSQNSMSQRSISRHSRDSRRSMSHRSSDSEHRGSGSHRNINRIRSHSSRYRSPERSSERRRRSPYSPIISTPRSYETFSSEIMARDSHRDVPRTSSQGQSPDMGRLEMDRQELDIQLKDMMEIHVKERCSQ
ncbi:uncharacterized protein LOC132726691 [Ruditapes philippinarum]|uniref:uncharacterized protein LOC132726691 n=1 Tax=Ruditapes philippinarum TaxID=129788 RepID=UPI00295AB7C2|nr:uncharacterized protein LOC132726691 [Ruditapes philippinarum]